MAEQFSPLVTFENSPVFVTADHPGYARDGGQPCRIAEVSSCWREGGRGDQTWGNFVMILVASSGPVGQRHCPASRRRPKNRQDLHRQGLEPPTYKKRLRRRSASSIASSRICASAWRAIRPDRAARLCREIKERGFSGGYSAVRDRVRDIRPARSAGYEVRFETPPGEQAQVDFARFEVEFLDEPGIKRIVWLFSMVLGYSRLIWARFVLHQDLQSVLRCHIAALEAIGGGAAHDPLRSHEDRGHRRGRRRARRQRALVDLARHYGFQPAPIGPSSAKQGVRASGRSATSARTSFSAASFAISRISTTSSAIGSKLSPTRACARRPKGGQ